MIFVDIFCQAGLTNSYSKSADLTKPDQNALFRPNCSALLAQDL
ncbi:hypothetical protein CEV31_2134 [Brucella thiophenivorans]|uniref:Uncharacterized protein n=1 Tax=Brucella thiophenivorans TaxID=571255 RepID=A0A256FVA3_9HYPH|nr:hypothetical protein CEV31_2134 [Brucella thiophenivorans]